MSYRKPVLAHTAFPGPLLDVLAGYMHLLNLGFASGDITVLGKSAGGHLGLMLLRYVAELQIPMPGGIGMMAPWCDLTMSFPSYQRHSDFDTLCRRRLAVPVGSAMRWYIPQAMNEGYFTPAMAGAEAWRWLRGNGVRVYIMFGTRELLEDEIRKMAGDMKAAGAEVRIREVSRVQVGVVSLVSRGVRHF
jgi:acetyl esterase/lipase